MNCCNTGNRLHHLCPTTAGNPEEFIPRWYGRPRDRFAHRRKRRRPNCVNPASSSCRLAATFSARCSPVVANPAIGRSSFQPKPLLILAKAESGARRKAPRHKINHIGRWYGWSDSNRHSLRKQSLSLSRLPFRHTRTFRRPHGRAGGKPGCGHPVAGRKHLLPPARPPRQSTARVPDIAQGSVCAVV